MDLQKYIQAFLELKNKTYNFIEYENYQNNISNFIKGFPILKKLESYDINLILDTNFDIIYSYFQKYKFLDPNLTKIFTYLDRSKINNVFSYLILHKKKVLEILDYPEPLTFSQKKKIYLGVLWFGIGFYITWFISKFLNIKKLPTLHQASQNRYLLFLTCCFIYYDDILDTEELDVKSKKICLDYTSYFFQKIKHHKYENIREISVEFENSYKINDEYKIIEKTNRVLNILFELQHEKSEPHMLEHITNLFMTELEISKNNSKTKNINELLLRTIKKSRLSILCIFQASFPNIDCLKPEIDDLISKFSFLSQLLDDLNDRELDIQENNNTIFTINNSKEYILLTLKYIYLIKKIVANSSIHPDYKIWNHYANILVFNYAIAKYPKYYLEFQKYIPIMKSDIYLIRKNKTNYLKNINNF